MEARNKTIEDWFGMIRGGRLTLPRFQRGEVWQSDKIEKVIENILRDPPLPIGALLVLEVDGKELFPNSRPIEGAQKIKKKAKMNLLDGQQRMTALWRSLHGKHEKFTVLVSLENEKTPKVEAEASLWAKEPAKCLEEKYFPVSLLRPGREGKEDMEKWIKATGASSEIKMEVKDTIWEMRSRVASYRVPFLSLPSGTDRDTAIEVYVRMNTSASPLRDFDIVVALYERSTGQSLHDMIVDIKEAVPEAKGYEGIEDSILKIGALLYGKRPTRGTYLEPAFVKKLGEDWDRVADGLKKSVDLLQKEAMFDKDRLPTEIILYLTAALLADAPADGAERGHACKLIRKTIWRAAFTARYQKNTQARAFEDYKAIRDLIRNPESKIPPLFDKVQNPLPRKEELIDAGWPKYKDRLGRAIMAASLKEGGRDFLTDQRADAKSMGSREYHHLYPHSQFSERSEADSALNCALISQKTNRRLGDKSFGEYFEMLFPHGKVTEEDARRRCESHLIPYDALKAGNFEAFREERAKMVHSAMQKLCDESPPSSLDSEANAKHTRRQSA